MGTLLQDLRYGFRMLVRNPSFSIVAVLTLSLGIAANTAIFSVVDAVLLRALPFEDSERLVCVWVRNPENGHSRGVTFGDFVDWREQSNVFEECAAYYGQSFTLTGVEELERIDGAGVTVSFFPALRIRPALGRAFSQDENRPGQQHVAVISGGFWERRFACDPNAIGRTLTLDRQPFTIIGVLPASFRFPLLEKTEVLVPMVFDASSEDYRRYYPLQVIGRLKPDVTIEQARAQMGTIASQLEQAYPDPNKGYRDVLILALRDVVTRGFAETLPVLFCAAGFILTMACANIASMLLSRMPSRQREFALRRAFGAAPRRLVGQLLTESTLLALVGGAIGLLSAVWVVQLITALAPSGLSRFGELAIDGRVLGFALVATVLTGLVFGMGPCFQVFKLDVQQSLKEGGPTTSGGLGLRRAHSGLVVGEIVLAFIVLTGGGLMLKSLRHLLQTADPMYGLNGVLTMQVSLSEEDYIGDWRKVPAFWQQVLERIRALPGVVSAAAVSQLPLERQEYWLFTAEDQTPPRPEHRTTYYEISPDYFRTMHIGFQKGRDFTEQDILDQPDVVIVNEKVAREIWPGQDPIGKRLKFGPRDLQNVWRTVVGVVRYTLDLEKEGREEYEIYVPQAQGGTPAMTLVVSATVDPYSLVSSIRRAVAEVDKNQPIYSIMTMAELLSRTYVGLHRFRTFIVNLFAVAGVLLAAVGLYGVISYSISQRTREIGIRMAMGAKGSNVLRLVIGHGMRLTLIGVVVGLAGALALNRFLSSLLFQISPTDPAILIIVSVLLGIVAFAACYVPARRAAKIDPMAALRYE